MKVEREFSSEKSCCWMTQLSIGGHSLTQVPSLNSRETQPHVLSAAILYYELKHNRQSKRRSQGSRRKSEGTDWKSDWEPQLTGPWHCREDRWQSGTKSRRGEESLRQIGRLLLPVTLPFYLASKHQRVSNIRRGVRDEETMFGASPLAALRAHLTLPLTDASVSSLQHKELKLKIRPNSGS